MILKTQFGFHQDTKNLPYLRKKYMHMIPDEIPNQDYKIVLSDLSDSEDEVSFCNKTNCSYANDTIWHKWHKRHKMKQTKSQFGFHQETKNLPYRKKYMHMIPDQFPSLDYKNLLSDLSETDDEVSFCNKNHVVLSLLKCPYYMYRCINVIRTTSH